MLTSSYTDGLSGTVPSTSGPPHDSKCRASPGSLRSIRGLPRGRLPHNPSEYLTGCPRPADPPRRVLTRTPTPPPPLTGTVRVRDAGPGLADTTPRAPCRPWSLRSAVLGPIAGSRRRGRSGRLRRRRARPKHTHPPRLARLRRVRPRETTSAGQWARPSPPPVPRGTALEVPLATSCGNQEPRYSGRAVAGSEELSVRVPVGAPISARCCRARTAPARPPAARSVSARWRRTGRGHRHGLRPLRAPALAGAKCPAARTWLGTETDSSSGPGSTSPTNHAQLSTQASGPTTLAVEHSPSQYPHCGVSK